MRIFCALCLFFSTLMLISQESTVTIIDSNGAFTSGSISGEHVTFHDANGNTAFGTIRGGNVFLTTGEGEVTFGTIRNGNVFLSDSRGVTTGTIRGGNIFLIGTDGSVTTGTYSNGNSSVSTTQPSTSVSAQQERQRRLAQDNYAAGYALGQSLGSAINAAVANHQLNTFCKEDPTATYLGKDGISTPCPRAELSLLNKAQVRDYCKDHPGSWISIGQHREDCIEPPNPINLPWVAWEMKAWQDKYKYRPKVSSVLVAEQYRTHWTYWQEIYCSMTPNSKYKDLDGHKQACH